MAVDTRDKRSSAIALRSPWRGLWPTPDGSVDQPDRQQVPYMYSGISAAVVAVTRRKDRLLLLKVT